MTVAQQLKEEGIEQGKEQTAVEMLKKHLSTDLIADVTGFAESKVIELAHRSNIPLQSQTQAH